MCGYIDADLINECEFSGLVLRLNKQIDENLVWYEDYGDSLSSLVEFCLPLRGDLVEYDNKLRLSYNVARIWESLEILTLVYHQQIGINAKLKLINNPYCCSQIEALMNISLNE